MVKKYFGNYLRDLRENHSPPLKQQDLAEKISNGNRKITQGLIAQYENGKVSLPDPLIIIKLADYFVVTPGHFVFRIALDIIDKYQADKIEFSQKEEEQLKLWEEFLNINSPAAPGFETFDYEQEVLRSTRSLLEKIKILDVEALIKWQRNLKDLKEFWVITPIFLDNTNNDILRTVLHNLSRQPPVKYVYFVNEKDIATGGNFKILINNLVRFGANLEKPVNKETIRDYVKPIAIPQTDLGLMQTDVVIANPQTLDPTGYQSIRYKGVPAFGVPIAREDLSKIVGQMMEYIGHTKQESTILPFAKIA